MSNKCNRNTSYFQNQLCQTTQITKTSNNRYKTPSTSVESQNTENTTFAKAVSKTIYPKKEQALIIKMTKDIQQHDYVNAIAKINLQENLIFIFYVYPKICSVYSYQVLNKSNWY